MAPIEGSDVSRVDRVDDVPSGEEPIPLGPQGGVDGWPQGPGIQCDPGGASEFVIGDPVAGEDNGVARDGASYAGGYIFDFDGASKMAGRALIRARKKRKDLTRNPI